MAKKSLFDRFTTFIKESKIKNPFSLVFQPNRVSLIGLTQSQFLDAYKGWVFACVQAIAQDVAEIDLRLMRKKKGGEPEEVFDHEIIDLLYKVNPRQTKHELIEITQSHLELEGNSFWFLARDGVGQIREIWAMRPDRVKFVPSKENPLLVEKYLYRQKDGKIVEMGADDIIHFANFNAKADYPFPSRGMGTVEATALAIDTNEFTKQWNKNFFLNSARPDFVLKTEGQLTPEEYERVKQKFEKGHQGIDKAHKFLLLQGGLNVDKLTANQREMDFIKQLIASRDEILAMFRVPKTVLGIIDDVNRANAEATNYVFALRTIKPKMQKIVDTLNEFLIPRFKKGEDLYFDFTDPVPENREMKILEYEKGIDKWLTRNEIRGLEGLDPSVDGNRFFAPFSIQPIDEVKVKEVKKELETVAEKKPKDANEAIKMSTQKHIEKLFTDKAICKICGKSLTSKKKKEKCSCGGEPKENDGATQTTLNFNALQRFGASWNKGLVENEKLLLPIVKQFFAEQEKRVIDNLKSELKGLTEKEFSMKATAPPLPDPDRELAIAIDLMTPLYEKFLKESGERATELVGISPAEFELDKEALDFIKSRAIYFGETVNTTTYEKLAQSLKEGLEAGEGVEELAKRVTAVYDNRLPERIARTEISAISNYGTMTAYQQANVPKKQWVYFDPPDADEAGCIPDPDIVPIDEVFSNGLMHPPRHPNCVCTLIPIYERE